jgi:hypothetical protein
MASVVLKDIDAWEVDLLRLTIFTTAPLSAEMLSWWTSVTGVQPEATSSRATVGIHTVEGGYKHARLVLNIGPGRIDWMLVPPAPSAENPTPVIGGYADTARLFSELLKPWIRDTPTSLFRIAYGAVLRLPAADKASAYKVLGQLIPSLKVDPDNSSDLMYQINRARQSKVIDGLRINRLSKWLAIHFGVIEAVSRVKGSGSEHFCRVELDVNTDLEYKPDIRAKAIELVDELHNLGAEILTCGDIP